VVAVTGFWIGILRVGLRRRYAFGAVTPYRGWIAWHPIAGPIGGVVVLIWMFSGWLSLNPGDFFAGRGTARDAAGSLWRQRGSAHAGRVSVERNVE
jgi:hypothetical protein